MTEQQQPTPPETDTPDPGGPTTDDIDRAGVTPDQPEPVDAPKDAAAEVATGYAIYDRTLGRYVSGVTKDKPSKPGDSVTKGHAYKVVRV